MDYYDGLGGVYTNYDALPVYLGGVDQPYNPSVPGTAIIPGSGLSYDPNRQWVDYTNPEIRAHIHDIPFMPDVMPNIPYPIDQPIWEGVNPNFVLQYDPGLDYGNFNPPQPDESNPFAKLGDTLGQKFSDMGTRVRNDLDEKGELFGDFFKNFGQGLAGFAGGFSTTLLIMLMLMNDKK